MAKVAAPAQGSVATETASASRVKKMAKADDDAFKAGWRGKGGRKEGARLTGQSATGWPVTLQVEVEEPDDVTAFGRVWPRLKEDAVWTSVRGWAKLLEPINMYSRVEGGGATRCTETQVLDSLPFRGRSEEEYRLFGDGSVAEQGRGVQRAVAVVVKKEEEKVVKKKEKRMTKTWFKCEVVGCAFRTVHLIGLSVHNSVIHNKNGGGGKQCPQCNYKAKSTYHLTQHLQKHGIGVKWKQCPDCHHKAKLTCNLNQHIKRHHPLLGIL